MKLDYSIYFNNLLLSKGIDIKKVLVFLIFCFISLSYLEAQTPAFPSAEGSGMYTLGGRGGEVYEVTNLSNSGAGSIVDAVSKSERTVVFRVSGTIELGDVILQPKSNVTIAGQTAPGDGICIKGRIKVGNNNIIIRYIRVRVDAGAANSSGDAIDISSGKNIIIDHVSASYARDETISCQPNTDSVTVQWCLMSEALTFEGHSYGSLVRGDRGDQKTYHHNLYAHCNGRLPRPGNYTSAAYDTLGIFFDFRNNVVYNWAGSSPGYNADDDPISRYNFIGNVYILGPESSTSSKLFKEDAYNSYAYFADNMFDGTVPDDQWNLVRFNGFTTEQINAYKQRSYLIPMASVTTTSPEQAYIDVLAAAGCSLPKRDTIDCRVIQDVINQAGHSIAYISNQPEGGWPLLSSLPAPTDSDHDGMPDSWELSHGLNPDDPGDRNIVDQQGYTALENYLNGLVGEYVSDVEMDVTIPEQFTVSQNFPNPFNPGTTLRFSTSISGKMNVRIYDITGRLVKNLSSGFYSPGEHTICWDGENENGQPVASGIYLGEFGFRNTRKLIKMQLIR